MPRVRPQVIEPDPKHPITVSQSRVWVLAERYLELVTEYEVLKGEVSAGANACREGPEE